jgi:beta-glucosidase
MISDSQIALARPFFKSNKPVVIVYFGGKPRIITEIAEKAYALFFPF